MHGGTVGTDPVAGQSQRGRRRGQPAAAVPILQVGEQKWHRCRALLGRLAALRQQGRLSAGDLGDVESLDSTALALLAVLGEGLHWEGPSAFRKRIFKA